MSHMKKIFRAKWNYEGKWNGTTNDELAVDRYQFIDLDGLPRKNNVRMKAHFMMLWEISN